MESSLYGMAIVSVIAVLAAVAQYKRKRALTAFGEVWESC